MLPPIKHLNRIRNLVAHNLRVELENKDKQKIFDSFSRFGRTLILEDSKTKQERQLNDVTFGHIYKVLIILMDMDRYRYVQWVRRRDAAMENVRSVLRNIEEAAEARARSGVDR